MEANHPQPKMAESGDAAGPPGTTPDEVAEANTTGARSRLSDQPTPALRAHVGIDAATKTPVFRGTERAGDKPQQDVSNSASIDEELDLHANAEGDSGRSVVPGEGMKVKEYFINFDSGDALGMMSPYMAACAQLLDIEYIISGLIEMKMLTDKEDPILRGLNNYMDGLVAMVKDVGMEPDKSFLANLSTQEDLDDLFALAQEAVVLDAMSSAGKLFAAAISAKKRRDALLSGGIVSGEEKLSRGALCTAAEYFTKLFRKVTAQEDGATLDLQVALIDKVSSLSNEISSKQGVRTSGMRAPEPPSDGPEADWLKAAKTAAADAAKAKSKYVPLNDEEVLMAVSEVLPALISEGKLLQPGRTSYKCSGAISILASKLMEKHMEKVPAEEKFSSEAALFANTYGDERAAVQALVLLADELNDFLGRLVIDHEDEVNDVSEDECDYEAEVEELEEGQIGEESSAGEGGPDESGVEERSPH